MTKLLVSVRSVDEARVALDAGVDVIDVKEPLAGALGAASCRVIEDVVRLVDGRCMTSVACGELLDSAGDILRQMHEGAMHSEPRRRQFVDYVKLGLAGCGSLAEWAAMWNRLFAPIRDRCSPV